MRLLKTFIPLVLPFISNPFGIFMLRQYFMQIPQEVIEAARLDDFGVACLKDIIRDHEPDVIMLHLSYLDHARHNYGGFAPEAKHVLLECDRKIGGLMDILREKGLLEQYNFCVMGDHGHLPVKQVFNPNILLVSEELIELDDEGRVKDYECYIHSAGLSAHGHLPIKGPQPIFFAAGPDIRENVVVERGNLIDEAPTYAAILGVEMPWAQGTAMTEILKHENGGNEM